MRKTQKRLSSFLVLLLVLGMLFGCGQKTPEEIMTDLPQDEVATAENNESADEPADSNTQTVDESAVYATPSSTGQLQVIGTQLCAEDGTPVQLRGISTHGIGWFPQYVNNDAFAQFHEEWGANVMRLAMYTYESGGYCTDGDRDRLLTTVYNGVEYATDNDMYVIIDWHVLNEGSPLVYESEALSFWDTISEKYADYNNVIYEICNEPCNGTGWSDIKSYANEIIPVIRANDDDAIIIVGTPTWSQEVDKAAADPITGYDNIMYTLHFYAATHKDDLRNKMTNAVEAGLPIFCTEYGICDASGNGALDEASANEWISTMNEYGISYVCWNLSNKNESSAIINSSCNATSGFSTSDLSGEGLWLYNMLRTAADLELSGTSNIGQIATGSGSDVDTGSDTASGSTSAGNSSSGSGTVSCGSFEVALTLENSWDSAEGTCYQYSCTITNAGSADVSTWLVQLDLDGTATLSEGWNGKYTVNRQTLTITNVDYNGSIPAGGNISDVGFIICGAEIKY